MKCKNWWWVLCSGLWFWGFSALFALLVSGDVRAASPEEMRGLEAFLKRHVPVMGAHLDVEEMVAPSASPQQERMFGGLSYLYFLFMKREYEAMEVEWEDWPPREEWPPRALLLEIEMLERLGRMGEALAKGTRLIEAHPDFVEGYLQKAEILAGEKRLDDAVGALLAAKEVAPGNISVLRSLHQTYSQRYQESFAREERQQALEGLAETSRAIIEAQPGRSSAPYWRILSFIYMEQGETEKAVEAMRSLIRLNTREVENYVHLARFLRSLPGDHQVERLENLRAGMLVDATSMDLVKEVDLFFQESGGEDGQLDFYRGLAEEYPGRLALVERYFKALMQADRFEEARDVVDKALEYHHTYPFFYAQQAILYLPSQDRDKSVEALKAFVQYSGGDAKSYLFAAEVLKDAGRFDDALAFAREMEPKTAEEREKRKNLILAIRLLADDREGVVAEITRMLEENPGEVEHYALLLQTLLELDRPEEAVSYIQKGLSHLEGEDRMSMKEMLVLAYRSAGNLEAAVEAAQDGKEDYPDNWRFQAILVETLKDTGRQDRARAALQEFQASNFPEPEAQFSLGLLAWQMGQPTIAEESFKRAVHLNGTNAKFLSTLAQFYWEEESFTKAEDLLRRTVEAEPRDPEHHNNLGYFLAEQGIKLDEALTHVETALEMAPGTPHMLDSLGWVYYQMGEYKKAVEWLEKAAATLTSDAVVLRHLGDAYRKLGRADDALHKYREALQNAEEQKARQEIERLIELLESPDSQPQ